MAKIIPLVPRHGRGRSNLITASPWEFRWSESGSRFFRQVAKHDPAALTGCRDLKGGLECTVRALFLQRDNEEKMRQIYYLTGLVDCMINRRHPLLRTNQIQGLYGKVMTLKSILRLNWHGPLDQVLLPVPEALEYPMALSRAATMQELYRIIRKATDRMFDILSRDYIFYAPAR
jgi:hypothetical protein